MTDADDPRDADDDDADGDSCWSPAGFEVPEPEREPSGARVHCAGCGEAADISEMGATVDETTETDDAEEAVIEVRRYYIHGDEDCLLAALENVAELTAP